VADRSAGNEGTPESMEQLLAVAAAVLQLYKVLAQMSQQAVLEP
jgi:hypothetical protein